MRLAKCKVENVQGVGHLEKLIGKKTRIAYSGDSAGDSEAKLIIQTAERLAAWAERTGVALKIEGWRYE
jgi:hypothetical protein